MSLSQRSPQSVCPNCGGTMRIAFVKQVLARYEGTYELCDTCELICVRPVTWLAEAYSTALPETDTGAVVRNETVASILTVFAWLSGLRGLRGLDVGGGHGLLVRMLRDRGLDFRWADEHAENLFARGFEDDGGAYAWLTLVEVFEHLVDPIGFLRAQVKRHRPKLVVFTTLLKTQLVPPEDWWYWCFETGQHVSFASRRTLEILAAQLGYALLSVRSFHVLALEPKRYFLPMRLACSPARLILAEAAKRHMKSLTLADHEILTEQRRVNSRKR